MTVPHAARQLVAAQRNGTTSPVVEIEVGSEIQHTRTHNSTTSETQRHKICVCAIFSRRALQTASLTSTRLFVSPGLLRRKQTQLRQPSRSITPTRCYATRSLVASPSAPVTFTTCLQQQDSQQGSITRCAKRMPPFLLSCRV